MTQPYGKQANGKYGGKPGLQAYFESALNNVNGSILTVNGWYTFLNYYFWMQSCVDYQIGRVMAALSASSFASSTIVVFTSDHGDYAGSHNMHIKGGALYDESINVPLYISFPKMRPPFAPATDCTDAAVRLFKRGHLFAFFTRSRSATGMAQQAADPYSYLSGTRGDHGRDLQSAPQQRRLSPFANSSGTGYQPYILHTTDEYPVRLHAWRPIRHDAQPRRGLSDRRRHSQHRRG